MYKKNEMYRYFNISKCLADKTNIDYELYKEDVYNSKEKFGEDDIEKIERFYNKKCGDTPHTIQETLMFFIPVLRFTAFFIGIIIAKFFMGDNIQINKFIFWSISLPFGFILYSLYIQYKYKLPNSQEKSIFDFLLSKYKKNQYDSTKHNHIMKLFTMDRIADSALFFALGGLTIYLYMPTFTSITYYYDSTFDVNSFEPHIISLFSLPWSWYFSYGVPNLAIVDMNNTNIQDINNSISILFNENNVSKLNELKNYIMMLNDNNITQISNHEVIHDINTSLSFLFNENNVSKLNELKSYIVILNDNNITQISNHEVIQKVSNGTWATFMILSFIHWVIIPRYILKYFTRRKLKSVIKKDLINQADDLLTSINNTVTITQDSKNNKENLENNEKAEPYAFQRNNIDVSYVYYEMDSKEKIEFNIKSDKELFDKKSQDYFIGLFGQFNKDDESIAKLENLVLVFTSPESFPDETFKDIINKILLNKNVKQIWIIPLVVKNDKYYHFSKSDINYEDWQIFIETFKNKKVSLYNER